MTFSVCTRVAVGVLAATLVLSAGASVAQEDSIGIRLQEVPVDRADDPRAQLYIIDHVAPGARFSRTVEIVNKTGEALDAKLYVGGARIEDGSFVPDPPGSEPPQLTHWIDIEPSRLRMDPRSSATATATIEVPFDASGGERYGVLWVEPPAGQAGAVRVVNRVGVRIYLSVGGGDEPSSDFTIDSLTARRSESGVPVVEARVENIGMRALDLSGELQLSDGPGGLSAGPFGADGVTTLAPGQSGKMFVELDPEIPAGPWLARMVARSGTLEKAVEATIEFPEAAGESSDPVEAQEVPLHRDRGVLIPVATGLVILMLVLLGLFWFFWRRRRDEDDEEETDENARSKATSGTG